MNYRKYIPCLDKKVTIKMYDNIWSMWPNRFYINKCEFKKTYASNFYQGGLIYEGKNGDLWIIVKINENFCDINIRFKGCKHEKDRRWTHPEVIHQIKQDLLKYKLEAL